MGSKNSNVVLNLVISNNNYLMIPEGLDAMIGVEKANMLVRLLYRFQVCILNKATDGGYFYFLQDEMLSRTGISKKRQAAFIDELENMELITTKKQRNFYEPKMFTFTEENIENIKRTADNGRDIIAKAKKKKVAGNEFIDKILSEMNSQK